MADFFQTLIAAVVLGSLFALVALGYTLVYGVLKFINFAHSDIFVLGGWTAFTVSTVIVTRAGLSGEHPPWWVSVVAFVGAVAVCCVVGYLIERFAYRPLRKAPRLNVLITAIGVSLLLQNVGQLPGAPVAREPDVLRTKPAAALTEAEKATNPEIKDGVATLRAPGKPIATVPFGPIPTSMPRLMPDAVLNEPVVVSGVVGAGSKRGQLRLDQGFSYDENRQYKLVVSREVDGAVKREELLLARVIVPGQRVGQPLKSGSFEAGSEFETTPKRPADEWAGARYELRVAPLVPIRLIEVLIVASAVALMAALQVLIYNTKMGTAMRAVSYNVENAALMGVNVNFVISFTFVLGTALAAAAAFLYTQQYTALQQTAHPIWVLLGLKAFVAAVVGGIGNVRGAVLGGFIIAAIELFGSRYVSTELKDVYVFGLLILVLLFKPTGLLGTPVREKV